MIIIQHCRCKTMASVAMKYMQTIKIKLKKYLTRIINNRHCFFFLRNLSILKLLYIYIYIYIYSHPQTDCFILTELFSVARHVGCSKPGSKLIQLYVRLSLRPLSQQAYHVWLREFSRYHVVTAAAVCLHFYTLSATRVLNSFEDLYIMRAAAENCSTRVLNPMGEHIYCHPQTDCLILSEWNSLSICIYFFKKNKNRSH